ncbi:MAG: methyltransferase domain-containing protein [Flavobacteriales bacterium]|nr:methyltransferase domain-containing protein [Flavobacteriales bacterium]
MKGAVGSTAAAEAFSRQAPVFDGIDEGNPIIARMRAIVRDAAIARIEPGAELLELNAGTGIDSVWFAEGGTRVLATDAAAGMIAQIKAKQVANPKLPLEVMECSFLELDRLGDRRFDHVFSNFGGLNCTAHLDNALKWIDRVLLPGGTCALVIMPRFSPWETFAFLKGHFKLALRRWRTGGTAAQVEGVSFPCYYYSPDFVRKHLGEEYAVVHQRALSYFVPPPHMERFPTRWPRLYHLLHGLEEATAHHWPFRNGGDHFLIILRKRS